MTEEDYKVISRLNWYLDGIRKLENNKTTISQLVRSIDEHARCVGPHEDFMKIEDIMYQIAHSPLRQGKVTTIQYGHYARLASEVENMLDFEIGRLKDEVKKIEERITIKPVEDGRE